MKKNKIIREDDGAGFGSYGGYANFGTYSPYGVHYASSDALYNTFIKPFVDVVDVTIGKTQELSQRAQTLLKVAFETIASTIIPVLQSDYSKIFEEEQKNLEKIKNEYAEVYNSTWEAFKNKDVALMAFFAFPGIVLTSQFAKKAPKSTYKLLHVLSGGSFNNWYENILNKSGLNPKYNTSALSKAWGESLIREDTIVKDKPKGTKKISIGDIITNKKFVDAALDNPDVKRMQLEAQKTIINTLNEVYKHAHDIMNVNSLEQLSKVIKEPIDGIDELNKIPPQQKKVAEENLLKTLKSSMKEMYVKN